MKLHTSIQEILKQLKLVFFGLIMGMIAVGFGFYLAGNQLPDKEKANLDFLIYIAPVSGIALLIISQRFYVSRIKNFTFDTPLHEKISNWQNASLLRMILMDGAVLVNLATLALTGNSLFILLATVLLGLFIIQFPSLKSLIRDLNLSGKEEAHLYVQERG